MAWSDRGPLSPSRPRTGSGGIISADREPCGRQKPTSRTRTPQGVKLRVEDSSSRRSGSGEAGGRVGAEAAGPGVGPAGLAGRTDFPALLAAPVRAGRGGGERGARDGRVAELGAPVIAGPSRVRPPTALSAAPHWSARCPARLPRADWP